ncbi:RFIP1 protein, partial [Atrichornis clamosus]|nr:RFIP1 protein [Atrichornis clamosus]
LRAKAAAGGGGSDAYAVMALGRDKFRTSVAERCRGEPLWREEATFELPARPAALRLTVLHRALAGADKFLGRAEVDLAALRDDGGRQHTRWYKLRSKPGKKEKERGEIEVDIQFMRSNMTASMFDLSMKDKSRSPFGKLKDKLKGKRSSGLSDTASAIVPSTSHSPADSEDEAVEKEKKKSKFKSLFSKPGLQKTSLSQSMSVLPTQQPSTQRVRLRPSDFQPQWDEESEPSPTSEQKPAPSPLFKSRKPAFLDSRQLTQGTTNHTKKDGLSLFSGLKSKSDPVSKSSLCINGSHVYMEETTTKDKTPTSSPSPHNLRRKQLFASEENLSSRPTKSPEEMERTSPSQAFTGPTSLETFKSMTLPSYKLLSSEEHLDTSVPPSVEAVRETKKPDHKKSALLSLVTGKKETEKISDAENIPDTTLQSEENTIPEEKSEEEARCPELPADLGRGKPSGDAHHGEDTVTTKQLPSPCEEERKPEKAAPAKTKAVKPRLGLSPEEEPKATLPTLAPDPLPAFLPVHRIKSANNPFISKAGQKGQVPDSENITSSASFTSPALAAELWNGKNPFSPEWNRASRALDPESIAPFPPSHHLAASVPKAPLPGQVSAGGNNPFAADWGQGAESSEVEASRGLSGPPTPSVPSDCHFNDNNPFVSKRGGQAVPAFQAVAHSSPPCPRGEECSSAGHPGHDASGGSVHVPFTSDVTAVPDPLGTLSDSPSGPPGLAPEQHCGSPQLQPEDSLESSKLGNGNLVPEAAADRVLSPRSELGEKQEACGGKRWAECAPTLEPQATPLAKSDSLSQVKPARGACTVSPREAGAGRAGSQVLVAPKPAPRRAVLLRKCPQVSQADAPSSGDGVKSTLGLTEASAACECFPQSGSLGTIAPPVTLRGDSSDRPLKNEGDDDLSVSLTNLKSALPIPGDRGLKLASLPVILEGGSDEELLGDCQESCGVAAGDKGVSGTEEQPQGLTPLHGEQRELSDSSAAAPVMPAALGGRGAVPSACKPGRSPVLPAGVGAPRVCIQGADSGLGVTSHSRECKSHFEKQELERSAGGEGCAECDFSEPSAFSSSLSSPCQPYSSSHSLLSDTPSHRAESPKKPTAEGFADKAGNSGKKKLLQAWVSPSETFPNQTLWGGETVSPKQRLHPVKPMNAMANKYQSKNLNVISTMNEKLLEMSVKKYDPSDPAYAYAQLTHDELIQLVLKQKDTITRKDLQVRELEDYIDNLLVRVMEETPNILRVSLSGNKKAGKM